MNSRTLKPKKCRVCRESFEPRSSLQRVCSPNCAMTHAREKQAKQERRERKRRLDELKTKRELTKEAQYAFNRFVRMRDEGEPCICCGRWFQDDALTGGKWDAGHYRSVGSAPQLRFNEDNCHRQLKICNQHGSGNAVDYRLGLIARIGLERVEALESDNGVRKWTADDLRQIRDHYRRKVRELRRAA